MKINGNMLRDMIVSGANNVDRHKGPINDLNVFPVPDGDTGTNMSLTLKSGTAELLKMQDKTVAEVSKHAASSYLKGARGNSGVILSLLFRGFAKGMEGKIEADGYELALALDAGVKAAYKAVMKPTEGTILTVSRVAAERGIEFAKNNKSCVDVLEMIIKTADETLERTPDMLPVLKQAGVVDSGGKGFLVMLHGMKSALVDGVIIEAGSDAEEEKDSRANFAAMNIEDIKFGYCTEFLINRDGRKPVKNPDLFLAYLEKMGDSIVMVDDEELIKVHIHTNSPGRVLQEALKYGYLTKMKIENMLEQFMEQAAADPKERVEVPAEKRYGFVAVSPGKGISEVFEDLIVDNIIEGGQTMNPSTEDILAAIDNTPAEVVFVLPNNKNIILAAQMTEKLSSKKVYVLPTKAIPEGIGALIAFDPDMEPDAAFETMCEAAKRVKSGSVTYAVRDSVVQDKKVKKGDFMGFFGSNIKSTEKSSEKALVKLLSSMIDENTGFVTIFYGKDVLDTAIPKLNTIISKKWSEADVVFARGDQPVYDFIISVE